MGLDDIIEYYDEPKKAYPILAVDNEVSWLEVIKTNFADYRVWIAESGYQALEVLDEMKAQNLVPYCCLVDAKMPQMDGFELIDEIRNRESTTPILLMTAYEGMRDISEIVDKRLEGYYSKSSPIADLVVRVHSACEKYAIHQREMDALRRLDMSKRTLEVYQGLAHDLKNLASSLINYPGLIEMMLSDGLENQEPNTHIEKAMNYLRTMEDTAKRTVDLFTQFTHNLVEIQKEAPDTLEFDSYVERIVREIEARYKGSNEVAFDYDLNCPGTVQMYPSEIWQICTNLLTNAVDAVSARREKEVRVHTVFAEGYVRLSVKDTGIGMTREQVERATQKLYTLKKTGTGLGLYMVNNIAHKYEGYTEIKSSENGTRVDIALRATSLAYDPYSS
ncbi:MAG: ATP-binding protein [Nanobdellota archaeon]